jgi:hypothetical protein
MGLGYSVIYEKARNELPVIDEHYFPILMLCRTNIIKFNNYTEFMNSIYIQEPDYIILSKTRKRKIEILEGLEGKSFKYELKRFGSVSKINNYYVYNKSYMHKIMIYDLRTNERVFDYRSDGLLKFDMKGRYSIYVF